VAGAQKTPCPERPPKSYETRERRRTKRSEIPHNPVGFRAKFAISKLFCPQAFDIPKNRQIKVFENLEVEKNYLMFSIARQGKYLPICGFLAQNKEIPNFYLEVVRPSPLAGEGGLRVSEGRMRGVGATQSQRRRFPQRTPHLSRFA
jgi:hypothetical protein